MKKSILKCILVLTAISVVCAALLILGNKFLPPREVTVDYGVVVGDPSAQASDFAAVTIGEAQKTALGELSKNAVEVVKRKSESAVYVVTVSHTFKYGKQFFHRNALNYAISKNDSIALNFIIESMDGMEKIIPEIDKISGYVSYDSENLYQDYRSRRYKTKGRTSCYDMAEFLRYLYNGYINSPDVYQMIINDMYYNELASPLKGSFAPDTPILHVQGRNLDMGAYMDCAIIDCEEPIAIVVYVEASSEENAYAIMQQIGRYTAEFVTSCYKT